MLDHDPACGAATSRGDADARTTGHDGANGAVLYFPGTEPPGLHDIARLSSAGFRVTIMPPSDGDHYAARLVHPRWGTGYVCSPRAPSRGRRQPGAQEPELPYLRPRPIDVLTAPWLTRGEKERILACRSSLMVICPAGGGEAERERKRLFRFARAVLGACGTGLYDASSGRHWSPAGLDDELEHDAALDVESMYLLHAIPEEAEGQEVPGQGVPVAPRIAWLHTHGLAEAGAFDIDILLPSPSILAAHAQPMRILAGLALEGVIAPGDDACEIASPVGKVALVPAERWEREAAAVHRALRVDGGDHAKDRVVLCDPSPSAGGALGVRPSRFLSTVDLAATAFRAPPRLTALSAERARVTLHRMESAVEEFGACVRGRWLSIVVDAEDGSGGCETLSFSMERVRGETVEAVLVDEPHHVASIRPGDRGTWPVERIVDWWLDTVVGPVSPRSSAALRVLRDQREVLRPLLAAGRRRGGPAPRKGAAHGD